MHDAPKGDGFDPCTGLMAGEEDGVARVGREAPQVVQHASLLYTKHYNPSERHVNGQGLIDLEWWLIGSGVHRLSRIRSGNPPTTSTTAASGDAFDAYPLMHVKLTVGLLHGYKDEFKNEIPWNQLGVAPALISIT